jgi:hypothetical protein
VTETAAPEPAAREAHESLAEHVGDWFRHADADAVTLVGDLRAELTDHAGQVLDVAGDALALVKLIAPQDAALAESLDAFITKVLTMAQSAAKIAATALASGSKTA